MHLFPEQRPGPRGLYPSHSELASLPLWTVMACALAVLFWNFGTRDPASELRAAEFEGSLAMAEGTEEFHGWRGGAGAGTEPGAVLTSPVRLDAPSGDPVTGDAGEDAGGGVFGEGGVAVSSQDEGGASSEGDDGQPVGKVGLRLARGMDRDGKRDGMWETFDDNGQRRSKGKYKDDRREGRWQFWSESGGLDRSGEYRDGLREGAWSGWHPSGSRRSEQTFRQGRLTGLRTLWYTNGQVKETGLLVSGLRQGLWQFYDFQGNPDKRTGTYLNGQRVSDGG